MFIFNYKNNLNHARISLESEKMDFSLVCWGLEGKKLLKKGIKGKQEKGKRSIHFWRRMGHEI